MSKFTEFLNLFKWDPVEDAEEEFDIDKELNDNWDKIDTKLKEHISNINTNLSNLKKTTNDAISTKANTTDVYNKTETDEKMNAKQDKLIAGTNITISNNTISAKDTTYSTATNSVDGLMSKTDKSKLDGLSNYNDTTIKNEISTLKTSKQDKLIAGTNITISNNTISATSTTSTTYSTATSSSDGLMSKSDKSKLDNIFNSIYPVGSIYMSVNSTSPATLFGGTWTQIKDRFLLACGSTYKAGATGGEATHRLTQNEIPNYSIGNIPAIVQDYHEQWNNGGVQNFEFGNVPSGKQGIQKTEGNIIRGGSGTQYGWKILTNGGGQAHNNMPPYLAVYMWKRTA